MTTLRHWGLRIPSPSIPLFRRVRVGRLVRVVVGTIWIAIVYVFIFAPIVVVAGSSFDGNGLSSSEAGMAYLHFPPERVTWEWYWRIPSSLFHDLWLSTSLALVTAVCAVALGVPVAIALIRGHLPGRLLLGTLFRVPLQIPFIVIGLAFLQAYYELETLLGLQLRATFIGLVLAHTFVTTPYVIGSVGAVLQRFDVSLEEAALSMGATRWRTFRRVTMPILMPGILAGAIYGFLISFGDVTISLFLSGPNMTPLPVEIFYELDQQFDQTIPAISTLVMLGAGVLLYAIQRLVGMDVLLRSNGNG